MGPRHSLGESTLMPLAASAVVAVYFMGLLLSGRGEWWEFTIAATGLGFAIWFWITEYRRAKRREGKGKKP